MRAVSFVHHLVFGFKGNVSKNAIALGDVDNDNGGELVIGNLKGDLAVFKHQQSQPWAEAHDLGMIMVVIVGDLLNDGQNSMVTISGEGSCNVFKIRSDSDEEERKNLLPFHTQCLPANTKVALLMDVDGDGEVELVLGLTDHVLRTYRWVTFSQSPSEMKGKLVGLHKWEFAEQIGSISLGPSGEGGPYVLVAQPGGTYINFQCPVVQLPEDDDQMNDSTLISKLTPKHHPLASSRMRNPNISSEILGGIHGIKNGESTSSLIAIATLDGTLMLVDGDEILWSLQVDHQLFSLTKLDLIGDGQEEVIACAWDGQTYMVNQKRQSVRFQFEEPVCTFTSGYYSLSPGRSVPVLVYVTFSDKVYLYYDVCLPFFRTSDLIEALEQHGETASLLTQLSVDPTDRQQLRDLYSYCLYDLPGELRQKES